MSMLTMMIWTGAKRAKTHNIKEYYDRRRLISKLKGQNGRSPEKGGYNLKEVLGLTENPHRYDRLRVRYTLSSTVILLILFNSLQALGRHYARKYLDINTTMRYQDKLTVAKVLRLLSNITSNIAYRRI